MSDAPPSYETATHGQPSRSNRIPIERRRSMEDELRPLPEGWIRTYDPDSEHQFFVNTKTDPPRSIWCHPLDDETYLNSLSPAERENISRLHRSVSLKDIEAETTDEEGDHHYGSDKKGASSHTAGVVAGAGAGGAAATAGPSSSSSRSSPPPTGLKKYGRRMKDKVTGSTHEQREAERKQRNKEEEEAYRLHMAYRRCLTQAMRTGEPQYLGKDQEGRELYIEPPNGPMPVQATRAPGGGYIGFNPYNNGAFARDARFVRPMVQYARPAYPYARPYGYGYGMGYGFPMMGMAGAGLLGGAMLGGLLF